MGGFHMRSHHAKSAIFTGNNSPFLCREWFLLYTKSRQMCLCVYAELPTSTEFAYFVRKFAQNTAVRACPNKYGILKNNHTERSKTTNPDKHAKTHLFTPNPGAILSGPHMQRGCRGEHTARGTHVALLPCIKCMHTVRAHVQCMHTRPPIKI